MCRKKFLSNQQNNLESLITEYSKVSKYKINVQKFVFSHIVNKQSMKLKEQFYS